MLVRKLKWCGAAQPELVWSFEAQRLGQDRHGTWLAAPRGTLVTRCDGSHGKWADALMLFDDRYVATFWRNPSRPDGPDLTVDVAEHVDVPEYVDLELDVFRYPDGRVVGEDEDEFRALATTGRVGADRLAVASATHDRLLGAVIHEEPFVGAAEHWWSRWEEAR